MTDVTLNVVDNGGTVHVVSGTGAVNVIEQIGEAVKVSLPGPQGPPGNFMYADLAAATAASIPDYVLRVYTVARVFSVGLGGAWYRRSDTEPSHTLKFQDALGAWWEIDEEDIWAEQAGALGDGDADDYTAIMAAITCQSGRGGGRVRLMAKVYAHSARFVITAPNVIVEGLGGGHRTTSADASTFLNVATRFKWIGASGGKQAYVGSEEGGTVKCIGSGFIGICFDANDLAGEGIEFTSGYKCVLNDIRLHEHSVASIVMDVVTSHTASRDCQEHNIDGVSIWNSARDGSGIVVRRTTATTGANVSQVQFKDVICWTKNGHGLDLGCCDNLDFFGGRFKIVSGGTGKSIKVRASERDSTDRARGITFFHPSYDSFEVDTGTYMASEFNAIAVDTGNGSPVFPVVAGFYPGTWASNEGNEPDTTITVSGGTLDLGLSPTLQIIASGNGATVTSFGPRLSRTYIVRFLHSMTLVHGNNLKLPTNANIVTQAQDWCMVYGNADNIWRVAGYWRASGLPLLNAFNRQTGGDYTMALSDVNGTVHMDFATACNFIIPDNANVAVPIGAFVDVVWRGAGQPTIVAENGNVTILSPASMVKIAARYGTVRCYKHGANGWTLSQNLSA